MVLTHRKTTSPRDPTKFPATQLFLLALVRVAEPIALTSIFPYSWQLVLDYGGDRANASFYAGLLISAFAAAEAITGMYWGGLSDRLGRKPVLIMGCLGTIASLLIVGFSFNFWIALFGRFIGGALNGSVGVAQTMVGELVTNPKHEAKAYAVMPFVWSVGIIIGPAVGGYFARPAKNFSGSILDSNLFRTFPYLLPNLICTVLMIISIMAGCFWLEETHPDMQPWSTPQDLEHTNAITPRIATQGTTSMPAANLTHESYGTFNAISEDAEAEEWIVRADGTSRPASIESTSEQKWFTRRVMLLMIALGIFTYHNMTYDILLPIFYEGKRETMGHETIAAMSSPIGTEYGSFAGGLGLTIQQCGVILAFNGLIALFVQAVVFPLAASWLGIWTTFLLVTVLHPVAYFIVPFLVLLPSNLLYSGIYISLAIRNIFSIVAYPLLLILIKEASPSNSCLGKINGLAASTGAACRTMASPIAGLLYGIGDKIEFTPLAWWASAFIAILGALQAFMITREKGGPHHHVRPLTPCRFMPVEDAEQARRRKSSVVRIRVQQEHHDSGYGTEEDGERTPFASRVYT